MKTVLFLFLVSTLLSTINGGQETYIEPEHLLSYHELDEYTEMCLKTEEPQQQHITAMTMACGNIYVFSETHVYKFLKYTDYDWNTMSFLRLRDMSKVQKRFSESSNVVSATFIVSLFIALRENGTSKWYIYDCSKELYEYKDYSYTLEEYIDAVSKFKKKMAKNTEYSNYSIQSITGFRRGSGDHYRIVACLNMSNECVQYNDIDDQIEQWNFSNGNELMFYEHNGVDLYSFIATGTGTVVEAATYAKHFGGVHQSFLYGKLTEKLFFGCPPSFCDTIFLDAMLRSNRSEADLFYGLWFLKWDFTSVPTMAKYYAYHYCRHIYHWIDAAFHDTINNVIYVFKENEIKLCKYSNLYKEWNEVKINSIRNIFGDTIVRVDAAFFLSGENSTGQVFLFHNDTVSKYHLQSPGLFVNVSNTPVKNFMSGLESYVNAAVTGWVRDKEQVIVVRRGVIFFVEKLALKDERDSKKATGKMTFSDLFGCPKPVTTQEPTQEPTKITVSMPKTIEDSTPKMEPSTTTHTSQETETDVTIRFKYIGIVLPIVLVLGIIFCSLIAYAFVALCGYCKEKLKAKGGQRGEKGYAVPAKPIPKILFRNLEQQMGSGFNKDVAVDAKKIDNALENASRKGIAPKKPKMSKNGKRSKR